MTSSLPPIPTQSAGRYTIEYHAPEIVELNIEVSKHPDIMKMLRDYNNDKISRLNAVAAACNVVMQGTYNEDDYRQIAIICMRRLYEKRTGLSIVPASILTPTKE
jgi:hypothetical protein